MDNTTIDPYDYAGQVTDYEYTEFWFRTFLFETPIYLYAWQILVVISTCAAIIFIITMLQKKLRSVTSYILCAIAISDSLTGIVTLPTYMIVYGKLYPEPDPEPSDVDDYFLEYLEKYADNLTTYGEVDEETFVLTKDLCEWYMLSRYFLSRMFHTVSIWLTVFLGTQRCLSVLCPLNAPAWFTKKKTAIICVSIIILSLLLHGFHIFHEKAVGGFCVWHYFQDCSKGSCIQLWLVLIIRHCIPCTILTITTVLMVRSLLKSSFQKNRLESMKKFKRGGEAEDENRLVSKIVTAIVIVFLLTEVPYGLFLLYINVRPDNTDNRLRTNRIIHITYEFTMLVTCNANFAVFLAFNRRFLAEFKRVFCCCARKPKPTEGQAKLQSVSKSSENPPETEMSSLTQ